jgi:hypothetical protein
MTDADMRPCASEPSSIGADRTAPAICYRPIERACRARLCPSQYRQSVGQDDRLVWRPIEPNSVFSESVQARRKHDTLLRRACEDVAACARISIEPVGIVERARANAEDVRKPFEVEIYGRSASAAEIYRDALVAGVRTMIVGFRSGAGERDVRPPEYGFDQIGRPGQLLTTAAACS